jgi:hypothetical protein
VTETTIAIKPFASLTACSSSRESRAKRRYTASSPLVFARMPQHAYPRFASQYTTRIHRHH